MTEIILLPSNNATTIRMIKEGLKTVEGQYLIASDINDLEEIIKRSKKPHRYIIMDYGWDSGYAHLLNGQGQGRDSFLKSNSVIFIHGNPNWVKSSLRLRENRDFNVIGYISVKESFADFAYEDAASVLSGVIAGIHRFEDEYEDQDIHITKPETFDIMMEQIRSNSKHDRQSRQPRGARPTLY